MPRYPMMQVDAFTTKPFSGNPCAVVFDTDSMSPTVMQHVAMEMNLSETAFVRSSAIADIGARYFTPAEEVPLAGHPTIATIHALIESGRLAVREGRNAISLELRDGPIVVEVTVHEGIVELIVMRQRVPVFLRTYETKDIAAVFGLEIADLRSDAPVQTVSTGTPQLFVPLKSMDALRRVRLDVDAYARLRRAGDFFSPHLFVCQGMTERGATFARHFGVPPDIPEDPFTGSATGGMAAFCYRYGLIKEKRFIAEQGHWMGRPGEGIVEIEGEPGAIRGVSVGGQAVTVIKGDLVLPA